MGNRPSDSFTLVSAGDCIVGKDISRTPGFAAVRKLIHQGDCAIGNLESVLMDSASLAATMRTFPFSGCLVGSPAVAADLRRSGFHVLSRANNHATDFGPDGIHMTDRALDAAGLRYAGVGGNRSLAQAPCFVDCQHGRVALISATSTYTQGASATAPLDRNPSRPGIQTLRVHRFSLVNRNELCMLRRLRDEQPAGSVLIPNP